MMTSGIIKRTTTEVNKLFTVIVVLTMTLAVYAEDIDFAGENDLKAVYIYNFTKYIQWPINEHSTFKITVLGNDQIYNSLSAIAQKRKIDGKKIVVNHINETDEISDCQILYVSEDKISSIVEFSDKLITKNILTISSSRECSGKGIMINFISYKGKLKFEIYIKATESNDLRISSNLLKLGIIK